MLNSKISSVLASELLLYLVQMTRKGNGRIPSLSVLSKELNMSIASLREQLEVARTLGFVEVRPKVGIRPVEYSFCPAVKQSLAYAIAINPDYFEKYSDMRNHIEASYWLSAVRLLGQKEIDRLFLLIEQAQKKLKGQPPQIPHQEHRDLHLLIYSRLDNLFVTGLLEAYWDFYEIVGLDRYADLDYLEKVWDSHRKMIDHINQGNFEAGYQVLLKHMDLLQERRIRP
jgi:DNA-binding FadR family transcriptional regulator